MDEMSKPGSKLPQQSSRRSKKRPSYGMRTVELLRGNSGFGFTLSGQGPCILSNIVSDSPAAGAGLRSGDHVIAVNGKNVSKSGHDDVVKLIGSSTGLLKLQIAESYCSNSSSEDEQKLEKKNPNASPALLHFHGHQQTRCLGVDGYLSDEEEYTFSEPQMVLPPFPRPFHMRGNSADSTLTESSVFQPYERPKRPSPRKRIAKTKSPKSSIPASKSTSSLRRIELRGSEELQLTEHEFHSFVHPTLNELRNSVKLQNSEKHRHDVEASILKTVVGYLGTIEIPLKDGEPGLAAIRNCIRRLRVEKKVHTLVLMCILDHKVVLINHHGSKVAEYPCERITFCGMYMDDKRFFGLVTSNQLPEDESSFRGACAIQSSSCHVFMTEPVLSEEMNRRAKVFQFDPTPSPLRPGDFEEFPSDARPIIRVVMSAYGKEDVHDEIPQNDLPQSGNNSGVTSPTNSDSGIGYRDDGDNVLLMDPQSPPPPPLNESVLDVCVTTKEVRVDLTETFKNEERERLTVQAMPLPKEFHPQDVGDNTVSNVRADESFNSELLDSQHSAENLRQSMQKYFQTKHEHLKKTSQQYMENKHGSFPEKNTSNLSSKPRLTTPASSSTSSLTREAASRAFNTLLSCQPNLVQSDRSSSVRSLEDVRFENSSQVSPRASFQTGDFFKSARFPTSVSTSLLDEASPLVKFLYNSDTNINMLPDANFAREQPLLSLGPGRGILRPCDQYPSEPGVLTSRPVSVLSGYGYGGSTTSAPSRNGDDSREEFEEKVNCSDGVAITDDVDHETLSQPGSITSERGIDIGRVGSWAMDFEKLLNDPVGLRTFAEFLKKEFSHENIYFWTACERYRQLGSNCPFEKRRRTAGEIIRRHLSSGATEPVNVDSHARQAAVDGLDLAPSNLFATAQKQIYNLMKFDSFSRFLKSELYNESLMHEMGGKPLRFDPSVTDPDPDLDIGTQFEKSVSIRKFKLDKRDSDLGLAGGEQSRRRSLLPSWNNLRGRSGSKDRSKSKDRFEIHVPKVKEESQKKILPEDALSHNTSNESEDGNCKLARVILPDKATTVVQTKAGETIRAMVGRLLEKRGLKYTSFDIFYAENSEKPLDLSDESTSLACAEVRVEPRVLFRLELPSKKSIGVKAKPAKLVKDVLGPILNQYNWELDTMIVRREGDSTNQSPVDLFSTVASIDNNRLVVQPRAMLEINSRLMEDILKGKSYVDKKHFEEDRLSIKSGSSTGSLNLGSRSITKSCLKPVEVDEKLSMPPPGMIPQPRRLPLPPCKNPSSKVFTPTQMGVPEELYEGLKIVQRGRLEDQRGTEINFEMPDFLKKSKENCGQPSLNNYLANRLSEPIPRRDIFPQRSYDRTSIQPFQFDYSGMRPSHDFSRQCESNFSAEGYLPSIHEAERFFGNSYTSPLDDLSLISGDSRLSFGMQRPGHSVQSPGTSAQPLQKDFHFPHQRGHDAIYETLSYKQDQARRWSSNISTVSAPNLTSGIVPIGGTKKRGDPPPLPPKPRLMNFKQQTNYGLHSLPPGSFLTPEIGQTLTDERGYSVSFV